MTAINGNTRTLAESQSVELGENLRDRILSVQGERYMLPEYGTLISSSLRRVYTPELGASIITDISDALTDEPGYVASDIQFEIAPDASSIDITIDGIFTMRVGA